MMHHMTLKIENLILIIQNNLDNKNAKIAWNACVALANVLDNPVLEGNKLLYSSKSLNPLLKALEFN